MEDKFINNSLDSCFILYLKNWNAILNNGKWKDAVIQFYNAMFINPNNTITLLNKLYALYELGKFEE